MYCIRSYKKELGHIMRLDIVNSTALFEAMLDVVMAKSQQRVEKGRYPGVQFFSLAAELYQQATNILVSFLKLYMIKKRCCIFLVLCVTLSGFSSFF